MLTEKTSKILEKYGLGDDKFISNLIHRHDKSHPFLIEEIEMKINPTSVSKLKDIYKNYLLHEIHRHYQLDNKGLLEGQPLNIDIFDKSYIDNKLNGDEKKILNGYNFKTKVESEDDLKDIKSIVDKLLDDKIIVANYIDRIRNAIYEIYPHIDLSLTRFDKNIFFFTFSQTETRATKAIGHSSQPGTSAAIEHSSQQGTSAAIGQVSQQGTSAAIGQVSQQGTSAATSSTQKSSETRKILGSKKLDKILSMFSKPSTKNDRSTSEITKSQTDIGSKYTYNNRAFIEDDSSLSTDDHSIPSNGQHSTQDMNDIHMTGDTTNSTLISILLVISITLSMFSLVLLCKVYHGKTNV